MPGHGRKLILRYACLGTLALVVVGLAASWIVAGRLVAPKPGSTGDPLSDLSATSISITSDSGAMVAGWHIRSKTPKGVIVLLHGIRESRLSMIERARFLNAAGYSIVMIDLQGHGETPGNHITLGHLEAYDVRAAVKFAHERHNGEPVAVLGVSLGGAAALLSSPLEIDAMILESVYPTIGDAVHNRVAARLGPFAAVPTWLLLVQLRPRLGITPSELRPVDRLRDIDCPLLMMSGVEDRHTTVAETRRMYSIAHEPKELWLVDGAAHDDLCSAAPDEYEHRVLSFLGQHMQRVAAKNTTD